MFYPEPKGKMPLPVVVVMHGWMGSKEKMQWIAERCAAHGFASIAVTGSNAKNLFAKPRDWIKNYDAVIRSLEKENQRKSSPLFGSLDLNKITLIGHSMGGGGALYFANETKTPLASIVALAPYATEKNKPGQAIKIPTLILTGNQDSVAPPKMGRAFYDALGPTTERSYDELKDVGHNDFEKGGKQHEEIFIKALAWMRTHGSSSATNLNTQG